MTRLRGLSPRVRGNPGIGWRRSRSARSIPARAGEPPHAMLPKLECRVYPRACGGTPPKPSATSASSGLSPRVRGNPARGVPRWPGPRSIPARAGEPSLAEMHGTVVRVYPRACGGTAVARSSVYTLEGLSPRVRGNRGTRVDGVGQCGSIPARAGEPTAGKRNATSSRVYPRACGGTRPVPASESPGEGLSPRVRGNRVERLSADGHPGSIPARAGEPVRMVWPRQSSGVYPRACGGTASPASSSTATTGLSPRVRGNPIQGGPAGLRRRSIPARAGEPRSDSRCVSR